MKNLNIGDVIHGFCNMSGPLGIEITEVRTNKAGEYYSGQITINKSGNRYSKDVTVTLCDDFYKVEHVEDWDDSHSNGLLHLLIEEFYNTPEEAKTLYLQDFITQWEGDIQSFEKRITETKAKIEKAKKDIEQLKINRETT